MRNPLIAGTLSLLIPGLGQIYNGRVLIGIIWMLVFGLVRLFIRQRSSGAGVVGERSWRATYSFKKFSRIVRPWECSSSNSSGWN